MARARLKSTLAGCAIAISCATALAGCGAEPGLEEPAREGLFVDVAGIDYNVLLTRQLNLNITPDKAFYKGPPPKPGHALYGVFVQVCNTASDELTPTSDDFELEDSQGNTFRPVELPEENDFAYHPRELGQDDCIPEDGSVAQQGPLTAAMVLFELPLTATENRPLELIIKGPPGEEDEKVFELDL